MAKRCLPMPQRFVDMVRDDRVRTANLERKEPPEGYLRGKKTYSGVLMPSDLVGFWRFGDAAGDFLDSSGNGWHAEVDAGTTALTRNVDGPAVLGDGDDGAVQFNYASFGFGTPDLGGDSLVVPDQGGNSLSEEVTATDVTMMVFFNRNALGASALGGLMGFEAPVGGEMRVITGFYWDYATNTLTFDRGNERVSTVIASTDWVHAAARITDDNLELIIDGALADSDPHSNGTGIAGAASLRFGRGTFDFGVTDYNGFWTGGLDEGALFARGLNDSEIRDIAESHERETVMEGRPVAKVRVKKNGA